MEKNENVDEHSLLLVCDRKPNASIIVAEQPTASARLAAWELQYHVKKITGTTLPIVTDNGKADGVHILVGESAYTRDLGIDANAFSSQEHMVDFLENTLVLIGKDQSHDNVNELRSDPTYESGKFGPAFCFDGLEGVITVPECGFEDEEGTLETWIYLSVKTPEEDKHIMRVQRIPATTQITHRDSHGITQEANSRKICYSVTVSADKKIMSEEKIISHELEPGWHHIATTHSSSEGKTELIIDGVSVGVSPYHMTNCKGSPLHIGGLVTMSFSKTYRVYKPFNGLMDGIRVSSVVRRASELTQEILPENDNNTTFLLYGKEGLKDCSRHENLMNLPGFFTEKGTLEAVYDFLEQACGVRWYLPSELGIAYSESSTLEVMGSKLVRKPGMLYRLLYHVPLFRLSNGREAFSTIDEMLWRLRMRMGGEPFAQNHSQKEYNELYRDTHPEWFAQGYDYFIKEPQFCFSGAGLVGQIAKDARLVFDNKIKGVQSSRDYFPVMPQDNGLYCKCEKCRKWIKEEYMPLLRPPVEVLKWEMAGGKIDGVDDCWANGTLSGYVWNFINEIAKEVGKTHPEKYIVSSAYWNNFHYPHGEELEKNICVNICMMVRNIFAPKMLEHYFDVFDEWILNEPDRRFFIWLYFCHPLLSHRDKSNCFPGFFAHTVVKQMQKYHRAGIRGMFIEHSSEFQGSFLLDQLELYVSFKLADNPALDGNQLIDEFFTLYYGNAAEPMKRLYEEIEEVYSNPAYYPKEIQESIRNFVQTEEIAWGMLGTDERLQAWGKLMEQAKEMAHSQVEKQRVELFEHAIWHYMLEGARQYKDKSAFFLASPNS
jgi:hypothetical protein